MKSWGNFEIQIAIYQLFQITNSARADRPAAAPRPAGEEPLAVAKTPISIVPQPLLCVVGLLYFLQSCRMSHRRFRKWAGGREQCLMRILRSGKHWSNGADSSISSINRASERQALVSHADPIEGVGLRVANFLLHSRCEGQPRHGPCGAAATDRRQNFLAYTELLPLDDPE